MTDGLEIPEDAPRWAFGLFTGQHEIALALEAHKVDSANRAAAMNTRIDTLEQQYVARAKQDEADYRALNRNVMLALVAVAVCGTLGVPGIVWLAEMLGWPVPHFGIPGAP